MAKIAVLKDDQPAYERDIGSAPTTIGRGSTNDLVLTDATVSWHHAVVWQEGNSLWVRDLRSTNGTFVNGRRIHGAEQVSLSDKVRLGDTVVVQVTQAPDAKPQRGWAVVDTGAGVRHPVSSNRFYIGGGEDTDLPLPGLAERVATLIFHANGEIWLGTDEDERPVTVGTPFTVAGHELEIQEVEAPRVATVGIREDRYDYKLAVTLKGPMGPDALLQDSAGHSYRVEGGNRAVLLYLLGKKWYDEGKLPPEERGWCTDEEIQSGVWGRGGDDNKLHVLLYRLRGELKKAGFDPWFIEKRHRHIRGRLSEVTVGQ